MSKPSMELWIFECTNAYPPIIVQEEIEQIIFLVLNVDDLIISGNDKIEIQILSGDLKNSLYLIEVSVQKHFS